MTLSPQWLDELRSRVTLSSVISRTTRLTKAGREFKACCPFHNEKTPSFTVNDEKGFYHCLAGETQVITENGRIPIADLAGSTVRVLSRNGKWITAPFHNYGRQQLWRIELSRNRQRKVLHATEGHRWFTHGRKAALTTRELRPGHRLEAAFPDRRKDWTLDPDGVRHGIVFGDGTLFKQRYGTLNLHGSKDAQLADWFPGQAHSEQVREGGKRYLRIYGGRDFEHMKQLPEKGASPSYILGFLAGYLATDGHVAKDGTVILNSSKRETLEAVRDMATNLGIGTFGCTTQRRKGLNDIVSEFHRIHFVASSLAPDFFLLVEARNRFATAQKKFERLRWQIVDVSPTERLEEVYCAEVPEEHAFAIDDNILTGNCFGCGAHGDVIRWMTDQRGLSFMDAVKELAAEAGMDMPAPDPRAAREAEQRDSLHDVMAAAQTWFVANLAGPEGAKARAYLATRGFDAHTLSRFGFGYAPEGRQALKTALKQFPEDRLIEAGLRIAVDDKEPYDRFRGRLMLPIEDARGRVIAFGGRILDKGKADAPKYLNSPDTPLFDKGRTLYNLHRAGPLARQSGRLIVVEGYMDVIALSAAGFGECVAPLGTALTERQIEMLWRLVETPILCFDGDAAGQRAAMRAVARALPLLRPSHSLQIVRLPAGLDPDDLLKRDGAGAMEALLGQAQSLIDTLWEHERDAHPLATPEDKAGLKARLLAHVDVIADPDIKALYRRELLDRFAAFAYPPREKRWESPRGGQHSGQRGRMPQPPRTSPENASRLRKAASGGARDALCTAVIAGLIRWPGEIPRHAELLARSSNLDPRFNALLDIYDAGEVLESGDLETIFRNKGLAIPQPGDYARIRYPFVSETADEGIATEALAAAIAKLFEEPLLDEAIAAATANFDFDEQQRLLQRKKDINDRMKRLTSEVQI